MQNTKLFLSINEIHFCILVDKPGKVLFNSKAIFRNIKYQYFNDRYRLVALKTNLSRFNVVVMQTELS